MRLTPRVREILTRMRDLTDSGEYLESELDEFTPGGWWMGEETVHGRVGKFLLQHCLISESSSSSPEQDVAHHYHIVAHHYHINEEGRKVLEDPNYIPVVDRLERGDGVP